MRAVHVSKFGGPEVLVVANDVPRPKPTGNQAYGYSYGIQIGHVVCRMPCSHVHGYGNWNNKLIQIEMKAAGVSPIDVFITSGRFFMRPPLPFTPGFVGAGLVSDVGDQVTKYKKGDRVFTSFGNTGCYAQYTVSDEHVVFPLIESLSFSQGAAAGSSYPAAYRALVQKCKAKPGESVLMHGASGSVGISCCQMARALGLKVLGTAGSEEGLKLVLDNGAHHAFNHNEKGYVNKILDATDKQGVDMVIDVMAHLNMEKDLQVTRNHGRIVMIGCQGDPTLASIPCMTKEITIHGMSLTLTTKDEWQEIGAYVTDGLEKGFLTPVVGKEYPLDKASEAQIEVVSHPNGAKGKIILTIP